MLYRVGVDNCSHITGSFTHIINTIMTSHGMAMFLHCRAHGVSGVHRVRVAWRAHGVSGVHRVQVAWHAHGASGVHRVQVA